MGLAAVCLAAPSVARADEIAVSSSADTTNGDVSSPSALRANPGADGISLREAILAADNTPGPHAITFSPGLAGHTIELADALPSVTRDFVSIVGPVDGAGDPLVTIDARNVDAGHDLWLKASYLAVRHLRFTGTPGDAVLVTAGKLVFQPGGPTLVGQIRIADNVFDNAGLNTGGAPIFAISVGAGQIDIPGVIRNVVIARNRVDNFVDGDGILVASGGADLTSNARGSVIEDVTIDQNTLAHTWIPIEMGTSGEGARLTATRVTRNDFLNDKGGIGIGTGYASGNVIEDTSIEGNRFLRDSGISVQSGDQPAGTGNVVRNTRIVNNLLDNAHVLIRAGDNGASQNLIENLDVINDTISEDGGDTRIDVHTTLNGATNNTITGLVVRNTILWAAFYNDFGGDTAPSEVRNSITCSSVYTGSNGNLCGDPKFMNPASGDYRLTAGSAAIDAGTSEGAPPTDLECRARYDDPATANTGDGAIPYSDIGAFEFGGTPATCPPLDTSPPQTTIETGPPQLINYAAPGFSFSSSEPGSTFRCRVDGGPDTACTSPTTLASLADGPHTFYVWAIDPAQNADTIAASQSFTVDTTAPETTISRGPRNPTNDPTPTFAFVSSEPDSTFRCRLDSNTYSPCNSPATTAHLRDGPHTFEVHATDRAGNADTTPATRHFKVDTLRPQTRITRGPARKTTRRTATFRFRSGEPGARFECRLDGQRFTRCRSPKTYRRLKPGRHRFRVRATDPAGNTDRTPAERSWTVVLSKAVRNTKAQDRPQLVPARDLWPLTPNAWASLLRMIFGTEIELHDATPTLSPERNSASGQR